MSMATLIDAGKLALRLQNSVREGIFGTDLHIIFEHVMFDEDTYLRHNCCTLFVLRDSSWSRLG